MSNDHRDPYDLGHQALLYTYGELDGAEAGAFEALLAVDPSACEALAQSVQLARTAAGLETLPDPAWRAAAHRRLCPRASLWQRLTGRNVYRGHPVVWTVLGGLAASLVLTLFTPSAPVRPEPAAAPAPLPSAEVAACWAELNNSNHLARAHDEAARRRQRTDDRRSSRSGTVILRTH